MRTPQAKSSTLRTVTVTMGLATAVAVPLLTPTGATVAELQRRVHVADDGILRPVTRSAVLNYQGAHRLVQDGIVGPRTAAALNARTAGAAGTVRSARSSSARVPLVRTAGDPRSIARALLRARGWSGQFSCLDRLWSRESGWKATAANPSGGAYGIPQSLPGNKMASAGADWRTNPATQIAWGLGYIAGKYGSPCAAWSHSQTHNWY